MQSSIIISKKAFLKKFLSSDCTYVIPETKIDFTCLAQKDKAPLIELAKVLAESTNLLHELIVCHQHKLFQTPDNTALSKEELAEKNFLIQQFISIDESVNDLSENYTNIPDELLSKSQLSKLTSLRERLSAHQEMLDHPHTDNSFDSQLKIDYKSLDPTTQSSVINQFIHLTHKVYSQLNKYSTFLQDVTPTTTVLSEAESTTKTKLFEESNQVIATFDSAYNNYENLPGTITENRINISKTCIQLGLPSDLLKLHPLPATQLLVLDATLPPVTNPLKVKFSAVGDNVKQVNYPENFHLADFAPNTSIEILESSSHTKKPDSNTEQPAITAFERLSKPLSNKHQATPPPEYTSMSSSPEATIKHRQRKISI